MRFARGPGRLPGGSFALALAFAASVTARAETLTVFAAASLRESLDEVARAFEAKGGPTVRIAYGATSAMARQIDAGAPAALFIAADSEWMDHLEARGHLRGPRVALLTNALVLVAPAASTASLRIGPGFALAAALGGERLAVADPKAVPAGKYARAALESFGAWKPVEGRLAPMENVRAALAMVSRGEVPLGIVYLTDARAERGVRIVDTFPPTSHPPIVYPLGVMRAAPRAADDLAAFLQSPAARAIWIRHGFGTLAR